MTNKKHRLDNLIYVFFNTLKTDTKLRKTA